MCVFATCLPPPGAAEDLQAAREEGLGRPMACLHPPAVAWHPRQMRSARHGCQVRASKGSGRRPARASAVVGEGSLAGGGALHAEGGPVLVRAEVAVRATQASARSPPRIGPDLQGRRRQGSRRPRLGPPIGVDGSRFEGLPLARAVGPPSPVAGSQLRAGGESALVGRVRTRLGQGAAPRGA